MAELSPDAVVVGSGPNGLAAAITLARAGRTVLVYEAEATIGGGTRSAELTLPGFVHDVCSAVHPLAVSSPFFRTVPLDRHGLQFVYPPAPLAHPLDDGRAAVLERSVEETAKGLGRDATAYHRLMGPLVRNADKLLVELLGPLRPPRHPLAMARFGRHAWRSSAGVAKSAFKDDRARALFTGLGAHSMLPLDQMPTASFSLMLGITAHARGWPVARGGSQNIADAMAAYLRSLGGAVVTGRRVRAMDDLPPARAFLFDVTPRQLLHIAGDRFPAGYRRQLERYRYGPGVFKLDWALDGPIPWRAPEGRRAGTLHLGGTLEEIVAAEGAVGRGEPAERPYVLLAQPSLFDPTRAPAGRHTAWAYCHVPNGCPVDMTGRIEAQVERFAPGFRDRILARGVMPPAEVERHNANYIGGDINGGMADFRQLFLRPTRRLYSTPDRQIYICSSSTPPTGGVHGMCGVFAAKAALKRAF